MWGILRSCVLVRDFVFVSWTRGQLRGSSVHLNQASVANRHVLHRSEGGLKAPDRRHSMMRTGRYCRRFASAALSKEWSPKVWLDAFPRRQFATARTDEHICQPAASSISSHSRKPKFSTKLGSNAEFNTLPRNRNGILASWMEFVAENMKGASRHGSSSIPAIDRPPSRPGTLSPLSLG